MLKKILIIFLILFLSLPPASAIGSFQKGFFISYYVQDYEVIQNIELAAAANATFIYYPTRPEWRANYKAGQTDWIRVGIEQAHARGMKYILLFGIRLEVGYDTKDSDCDTTLDLIEQWRLNSTTNQRVLNDIDWILDRYKPYGLDGIHLEEMYPYAICQNAPTRTAWQQFLKGYYQQIHDKVSNRYPSFDPNEFILIGKSSSNDATSSFINHGIDFVWINQNRIFNGWENAVPKTTVSEFQDYANTAQAYFPNLIVFDVPMSGWDSGTTCTVNPPYKCNVGFPDQLLWAVQNRPYINAYNKADFWYLSGNFNNVAGIPGSNLSMIVRYIYNNYGLNITASPPNISSATPYNHIIYEGENTSFSVSPTGTAPFYYQWRLNGANISGANSATYSTGIVPNTTWNGRNYSVTIWNAYGSITSRNATLSVWPVNSSVIISHPSNITVNTGEIFFFEVATNSSNDNFQWYKNGSIIINATTSRYEETAQISDNQSIYFVKVNNSIGSVYSKNVTLTVLNLNSLNIINNGGFESGVSSWLWYSNSNSSYNVVGGSQIEGQNYALITSLPGSNVQLYQINVSMMANQNYTFSFYGKSTSGNDISISFIQNGAPYTNYGLDQIFNITPTWASYSVNFKASSTAHDDARLKIFFDQKNDVYSFDNFQLTPYYYTGDPGSPINSTPIILSLVNGTPYNHNISISYDVNQSNALTYVRYSESPDLYNYSNTESLFVGASRVSEVSSLKQGTKYYYSGFAYNISDSTFYSNTSIQNFTTLENITDCYNVSVVNVNTSVEVYYNGSLDKFVDFPFDNHIDSRYHFSVQAYNASGNGTLSDIASYQYDYIANRSNSITNASTSSGNFWINNTWTNPVDEGTGTIFNNVTFKYENGTVIQNVTNTTQFLNLTYYAHYTQNISAQTVDIFGNENATKVWFNATIANNAPILETIGTKNVTAGQYLNITLNASDIDQDSLYFDTNTSFGQFINHNSSNNITISTVANQYWADEVYTDRNNYIINNTNSGNIIVTWTVKCDYALGINNCYSQIRKNTIPIGSEHILTTPDGNGTISETYNESINTILNVSDIISIYTYIEDGSGYNTMQIHPAYLDYSSQPYFSWKPTNSDIGAYNVNFNVTDEYGGQDNETIIINVTGIPQINSIPAITNILNETCSAHYCIVNYTINQTNAITQVKYGQTLAMVLNTSNQSTGLNRTDNLTNLVNNTFYYYMVQVWNSTNTSLYSNSSIYTFTSAEDYVPPLINGSPIITAYNPTSPYTTYTGNTSRFNITVNQTGATNWTINDTLVQTNASAAIAYYNNSTAGVGTYIVNASFSNVNGTANQSWIWIVQYDYIANRSNSITNASTSSGNFWINNTWTNPVDEGTGTIFNHTIFKYGNGTTIAILGNTTNFLNITTYPENYTQNISAQTVDYLGNENTTLVWFNATTNITSNPPSVIQVFNNKTTPTNLTTINITVGDTIQVGIYASQTISSWTCINSTWYDGHTNLGICAQTYNTTGIFYPGINGSNINGIVPTTTWTVNVTDIPPAINGTPLITAYQPTSPYTTYTGNTSRFNITVNQTGTTNWTINGTLIQTNASAAIAYYNNSTAGVGTYIVNASFSNINGTANQSWVWIVQSAPAAPNPPILISHYNNRSTPNTSLTITLNNHNFILFGTQANQSIDSWTCTNSTYYDGFISFGYCYQYYDIVGTYYPTLNGTNSNGNTNTTMWTVTVVSDGSGDGTDWDWLSGTVNVAGATITTNPSVCTTTGGAYSCDYVFEDGLPYWVNVSKIGYVPNNTLITFNEDHELWNPILTAIVAPSITSWGNNNTNDNNISFSVLTGTTVIFNITSNQPITSCNWGGATQINCTGTTTSYASKTFTSLGANLVTIDVTNPNGTSSTLTWTATVSAVAIPSPWYNVHYEYGCIIPSGLADVGTGINKLFRLETMIIIVVLLIIIIRVMQENIVLGLMTVGILVIFTGAYLPFIIDSIDGVDDIHTPCIDATDSRNISGLQDTWIILSHHPIKTGTQVISNSTYTATNVTDYLMNYTDGTFYPKSTGGLNFNN